MTEAETIIALIGLLISPLPKDKSYSNHLLFRLKKTL